MARSYRCALGLAYRSAVILAAVLAISHGCKREETETTTTKGREKGIMLQSEAGSSSPGRSAEVIVTVDGRQLTREGLESQIDRFLASQNVGALPPQALLQARRYLAGQVVQRFVTESVLLNEAERKKIKVPEADITATMDEIRSGLPEGVTLSEALTRVGATEVTLRKEIEQDLKIRALLQQQMSSNTVTVTDAEVETFYREQPQFFEVPENVHARHILVECATNAPDAVVMEKKAKAEAIRKQLVDGGNFAELAAANSDCPSAKKGGDLGTVGRGQTVKEFEDAAFAQATNEIGPVVRTRFGYHIIQVLEHNPAGKRPLETVKGQISAFLQNRKQQEILAAYVDQLKSRAKITYAAGFEPVTDDSGLGE
ncbi:MAG: peptidylprolyl isomerase [Kiritimatiellae bacterium]|nr:peptidylprolyl isomerase [Kiritimatiellia bacterium]